MNIQSLEIKNVGVYEYENVLDKKQKEEALRQLILIFYKKVDKDVFDYLREKTSDQIVREFEYNFKKSHKESFNFYQGKLFNICDKIIKKSK
ncbi:MAG: hypothetical protein ABIF17_04820 [Patescibacteria group bacterium]